MNIKVIRRTLGIVLLFEAACLCLPLICAIIYRESEWNIFAGCAILCLALGFALKWKTPKDTSIYSREGFAIVALSWITISLFGSIPFILTGACKNFFDAFFESASGFTTTGASILSDVEILPKGLLFWRSFTHWVGGMGVLVLLIAVFPLSGGSNLFLVKAESTGPAVGKLVPKVRKTAKILYTLYIALTTAEIIFLLCGGLDLFESLTVSFGTAGTGGFSVTNSGMAGYSSYVQIVVTVFMILFGIDFSVFYLIIIGKISHAFRSEEVRTYLGLIAVAIVVICFNCRGIYGSFIGGLKDSAFQVAAIITTTGYSTADFNVWPELSKTILVILMFVGACAGSTGGGMKVSRILILLKSIKKECKIAAHPKTVHKIKLNGRMVEHETVRAVNVYFIAYLAIFAASLLIISLDNFDFTTNFTAVASVMNNIGPGLAKVGPLENFSLYSPLSTFVLTVDMLIGRLEVFPILVLLSPYTWRK